MNEATSTEEENKTERPMKMFSGANGQIKEKKPFVDLIERRQENLIFTSDEIYVES